MDKIRFDNSAIGKNAGLEPTAIAPAKDKAKNDGVTTLKLF